MSTRTYNKVVINNNIIKNTEKPRYQTLANILGMSDYHTVKGEQVQKMYEPVFSRLAVTGSDTKSLDLTSQLIGFYGIGSILVVNSENRRYKLASDMVKMDGVKTDDVADVLSTACLCDLIDKVSHRTIMDGTTNEPSWNPLVLVGYLRARIDKRLADYLQLPQAADPRQKSNTNLAHTQASAKITAIKPQQLLTK